MSAGNGVIRVGRKGRKKFAFGDEGAPFEVDVVVSFQAWLNVDEGFREDTEDRTIPPARMAEYHRAAVQFVQDLAVDVVSAEKPQVTTAEALDFLARLREQYDEVAAFFRPRSIEEQSLPDSSEAELRFSVEPS